MVWLVLEDNKDRMYSFREAAAQYEPPQELKLWRIAKHMISEIPDFLSSTTLISLDHDLYRHHDDDPEPGTGREIADDLATLEPICPIIVHSTNTVAAWGMYNELTHAKWQVELIHHLDEPRWIQERWAALARKLCVNDT